MRRPKFSAEQIIAISRVGGEEMVRGTISPTKGAGAETAEVCRRRGISGATFYAWKAKLGGMEPAGAIRGQRRLKALEDEHARLKRLPAETELDNTALKVGRLRRHWFGLNGEGCRKL